MYLLFVGFLFFNQTSMVYFPSHQDFFECSVVDESSKIIHNNTRMYLLRANKPVNSSVPVAVFYHGNAASACDMSFLHQIINAQGFDALFVEYAGYGNDGKSPSKNGILQNVRDVHNFIMVESYDAVVVIGESLGTGVASYHAYHDTTILNTSLVKGVLLISPYTSLADVAQSVYPFLPVRWLLRENFHPQLWLHNYEGHVKIIHARSDQEIPYSFGLALYDSLSTPHKQIVLVDGVGHNTIHNAFLTRQSMSDFLRNLNDFD